MMDYNKLFAQANSVILQGPMGVGKSTVAEELSKQTSLPHVWVDTLRECPRDIDKIEDDIKDIKEQIANIEKTGRGSGSAMEMLAFYKSLLWLHENYLVQRKLFPNLPNYFDFGFEHEISTTLNNCYGPVAWHMYHKQFENRLLEEITNQVDFPCILDLGGGMATSPTAAYNKERIKILNSGNHYFAEWRMGAIFDYKKMDFSVIEKSLKPFKQVVTLKSDNCFSKGAASDKLNEIFVATGDFDKTATLSVDANDLFPDKHTTNKDKLNQIVAQILSNRSVSAKVSNEEMEMAR